MSKTGLFVSPEISVIDITVISLSLAGVQLDVLFSAHNRNPCQLEATRIVYLLQKASDNTTLAEGVSHQTFILKPGSVTSPIRVPINFSFTGLGAAAKSLMTRGKTKIVVSGEITFDAPMAPGGIAASKYHGEIEIHIDPDGP